MAIRVENDGNLSFGIMTAQQVISHVRLTKGALAMTVALGSNVTCDAGERLRIPNDGFDVLYPSGDLTDAHMDAVVKSYWDGETFMIDALTNSTTVVSDTGYSQVSHSGWTFGTEADPT